MARIVTVATLEASSEALGVAIIDALATPFNQTPAWIVYALSPVLWQARCACELQLIHLGTRVLNFGTELSPCCGQTVWGRDSNEQVASVAWDWVEVRQGVVAMSDPFGVVTNLTLLDEQGEALSQREAALHLHQLVHGLPWQSQVRRVLSMAG
jgi:hypothetical protein